jgi:glycosyltransferase involved in cell wall biosynthesis
VYNGERYLAQTLDSLLGQTYRDLEIIIGDNASTDRTEEIGRAYAARDSRVRYVRHERNLGIALNCMRLLALARGELFRWAAADDVSAPELVQQCVEALDREPSAILAYPKTTLIDAEGQALRDYEDNLDLSSLRPSERFRDFLLHVGLCNVMFGLMRTTVVRRTRGLRSYVASDIPLLAELALYGRFVEVPRRLFFRRFHPEASSALQGVALQSLFTPGARRAVGVPEWRRLRELTVSVLRAPIPLEEKLRAGTFLMRWAKWRSGPLARELGSGLLAVATLGRRRS